MGWLSSIGSFLGPIGGIVGGIADTLIGGNASNNAAKDQQTAANVAAQATDAQYQQTRQDAMPWLKAGGGAVTRLSDLVGTSGNTGAEGFGSLTKPFTMADFVEDPGYQFALSEGQKALERSASAKGKTFSGETGKALTRFGQGTAAQEYDTVQNRWRNQQTDIYNRLAGLSGTGQTSATNLGTAGANTTNNANDALLSGAAAGANGSVANANQWTTGLNRVGNSVGDLYGKIFPNAS